MEELVEPWDVASWNDRCLLLLDAGEKVRDVLDVDVDPMDVIARVTLIGAFRRDPSASPSKMQCLARIDVVERQPK